MYKHELFNYDVKVGNKNSFKARDLTLITFKKRCRVTII